MRRRSGFALAAGLALLTGLEGSATPVPPPGFMGAFAWLAPDDSRFGGLSALDVTSDGGTIIVISDHGGFAKGRIQRNSEGRIAAIQLDPVALLKGKTDAPLLVNRSDSEGLAMAADGTAFVSFEGAARILRYSRLDGPAENLPSPPEFENLQKNAALEALAIDPDGTLYTLPERWGPEAKRFPVFRYRAGVWDSALHIPRLGGFVPVAADFGPDGQFYLLERQFRGLAGFSSRLRRFALTEDGFGQGRIILETPVGLHDNLEGLAVWRNASGKLVATMVADDNFNWLLSSEVVEYQLPD